jgi:hypothetical protein
MPSARGIRTGRAFVELFAKDGRLVKGLRRAAAQACFIRAGIAKEVTKADR